MSVREANYEVVIVGGGVGACAAALALADSGRRAVMIEPSAWIGGQLTSQAVPPDENRWVESFGSTRTYRQMRTLVRQHYRDHESLTPEARSTEFFNPGGGWVSRLCASPRIFHRILRAMLEPHVSSELLTVLTRTDIIAAETDGDTVMSVRVRHLDTGEEEQIYGKLFLEASETGDLLELAGIESRIGAECSGEFGEIHAPDGTDERCQQPPSWCFALEHRPGDDSGLIDKPAGYDILRNWVPEMTDRPWPGPLFSWIIPTHSVEGSRTLDLLPWPDEPGDRSWELWRYRRIVEAEAHTDGRPDVCLVNWVQMDDFRTPFLSIPREQRIAAWQGARQLSMCLLYWMQNEAPRRDGGQGFSGLRLRGFELGTEDGLAMMPYIREPRRLLAKRILSEADIGSEQRGRPGAGQGRVPPEGLAEAFEDAIAIGHYHIDLHPTPTGRNSVYVEAAPFQIPLRSLVPVRLRNVLAAGKCLGVTHIANGATRMHTVEWSVGEAAGIAAAECLRAGELPESLGEHGNLITGIRELLEARGVPLAWPWES